MMRTRISRLCLMLLMVSAICMTAVWADDDGWIYGSKKIIPIAHEHTVTEIVNMAELLEHTGFTPWTTHKTAYRKTPSFTAPYSAGSLLASDIADAENALKMVRFLAGVPYEDVRFRDDLNNIAQHGAVLLAASDQFSHYPDQPADMSDDFYELGYQGCSQANISAGRSNLADCVLGFVYDAGSNNIERAGHRRWIFNPGNQNFGIGYAQNVSSSYGGHRINMHVFDGSGPYDCEADSYIAWPNAGAFPIQYFVHDTDPSVVSEAPWSINLGAPYQAPQKSELVLKLTRQRDGKTWVFDASTPNLGVAGLSNTEMHLSTDNDGYGIRKAIVFRPDPATLKTIKDGDVFTVELSGIYYTNGDPAVLSYDINFFDLQKAMQQSRVTVVVQHMGLPLANAEVRFSGQTYLTDAYGTVSFRVSNHRDYSYSVMAEGYDRVIRNLSVSDSDLTAVINFDEHRWDSGTVTVEATRTQEGSRTYTCTVCQAKRDEVIPVSEWQNPFSDISRDDAFYRAVEYVYENKLFIGTSDTTFSPEMTMTRGMFVTVLGRMAGIAADAVTESDFADVVVKEWYAPFVAWAVENAIVLGYDNGNFGPNDKISIEQACVILARYAAFLGWTSDCETVSEAYADRDGISDWAYTQVAWMTDLGVYTGRNGYLSPKAEAQRGVVADMMYRFSEIEY